MKLGDHTIRRARFSDRLSTARRSEELKTEKKSKIQIDLEAATDGIEDQPNDRGEISNEAKIVGIASCGAKRAEEDPIRFEALANEYAAARTRVSGIVCQCTAEHLSFDPALARAFILPAGRVQSRHSPVCRGPDFGA